MDCDVLVNLSGLGWGELVEQRGAGPYWSSTEKLFSLRLHGHGQLKDNASRARRYLFQLVNERLVILIANFFDV